MRVLNKYTGLLGCDCMVPHLRRL